GFLALSAFGRRPRGSSLLPYTTLFRSRGGGARARVGPLLDEPGLVLVPARRSGALGGGVRAGALPGRHADRGGLQPRSRAYRHRPPGRGAVRLRAGLALRPRGERRGRRGPSERPLAVPAGRRGRLRAGSFAGSRRPATARQGRLPAVREARR